MIDSLTQAVARHSRIVLLLAGVLVVVSGVVSLGLYGKLTSDWTDWDDPSAANVQARRIIEQATGVDAQHGYILLVQTDNPIEPGVAPPPPVQAALDLLQRRTEVRHVVDYRAPGNQALISVDGHSTAIFAEIGQVDGPQVISELTREINDDPLLAGRVSIGGSTIASVQGAEVVLEDLKSAELIVLPLLLLGLIVVFRGIVAAVLPMIGAAITVLLTLLAMRGVVEFTALSIYGLNLVVALGVGLSIDYSLLIISRYRDNLASIGPGQAALRATMDTAGRTVLYSGLTIASALVGLLVFPQRLVHSMGIAGILVTASALAFALVLLPALLTVLGGRIEALAPARWQRQAQRQGEEDSSTLRWRRIARTVIRRPMVSAICAASVLLILAYPLLGVRFTGVLSGTTLPDSVSAGHVAAVMSRDFTAPVSDREQLVVDAPATDRVGVADIAHTLRTVEGIAAVGPPQPLDNEHWLIPATLTGQPISDESSAAVNRIADLDLAYPVHMTGPTADALAVNASLGRHLPLGGLILIVATIVVLFAMTGSVVLPIKAIIMNALSLGAALGVVTFVFQDGHFAGLLSTTAHGALEPTSLIVLAAVAFGLSTDYGVFLLGRIKESHDLGLDNRQAVTTGIEHTGRIVTSAAALLCLSMCALLFSRLWFVQELGLGAALAVILDATIVRAVLVPSLMALLGNLNWWAPKPLRVLHMRIGLSHSHAQPSPTESDVAAQSV